MSRILPDNRIILIIAILAAIAIPIYGKIRETRQTSPTNLNNKYQEAKQTQEYGSVTTGTLPSDTAWLNNTIWEYPGGDMKASRIVFRSDGHLVFEVEFTELNPSYWQYDEKEKELYFIIPNVSQEMLNGRIKRGRGQVQRVLRDKRTLIYDFDKKTEVFDFMGWNYFKKREY